jgi:hypothetical protein
MADILEKFSPFSVASRVGLLSCFISKGFVFRLEEDSRYSFLLEAESKPRGPGAPERIRSMDEIQ